MKDMTQEQIAAYGTAVAELEDYARTVKDRDARIWRAHRAGVAKAEIARRMKISRDTVVRVLGSGESD